MRCAGWKFLCSGAAGVIVTFQVFGSESADVASDLPTHLPPYWVEAEPLQTDDLTSRPFTLTADARSGRSTTTLKDSLAEAPGALLQESFGGFEPPRLSIRGSGLQSAPSSRGLKFLLDGFPLGLADGSFNSALIDPQLFDRIEYFRGDAAARVAPAVLGGAFNFRTDSDLAGTNLRAEGGSFDGMRASLAGRSQARSVALDGAFSLARQHGFRELSAQNRGAFFASVERPAPVGFQTSVSIYHVRAAYDVPGPLTLSAARSNPRSSSTEVKRDLPRRESGLTQLTAQFTQRNSQLELEGGLSWLRSDDWFRQLQANGISDSRSDDATVQGALTRRFDSASGDNLLRLGVNISRGWRDLRRFRNDASDTGPMFGHDGLFATAASIDGEGTVKLRGNLAFTTGLTALTFARDLSDRFPTRAALSPTTTLHMQASALQPRARLTWAGISGITLHTSYAVATEPPTFDDLLIAAGTYPNLVRRSQHLDSQRAETWEVGTSGTRGAFGWDVTGYTAEWRHEILRLADERGLPRGAVNAGPTRHRGIEVSGHWRIIDRDDRLSLVITGTWNHFAFSDDAVFGRNRLAGAPPHQGSARLLYEHPSGFFVSPAAEWTAGATPVDHAGRLAYGGNTLIHLRSGWRKTKAWTVFVELKNLLDHDHIASTAGVLDLARNPGATAVFLPGVGRTLTLGFEWTP